MKSKAKLLTLVTGALMALGMLTGCGGGEKTKYQVSYDKSSAYYTVQGINAEGYEKDAQVTFSITALRPEEKTIGQVKQDENVLTADASGNYTFKMPEKNVNLTVGLNDVDHYVLSYTGTAQVDEKITVSLSNNGTPVVSFSVDGASEADKAKFAVKDTSKPFELTLLADGELNLVAKVGEAQVATLKIDVAASPVISIAEAYAAAIKEAPCNGKAGNKSAKTTTAFQIAGEIVYISDNTASSGYSYNVLIDDGTDIAILIVFSSKDDVTKAGWTIGDSVKTTCKFTNYFGLFEGIGTDSTDTTQKSLFYENVVKIDREFTPSEPEAMTGAQFDTYYNQCKVDGASGAKTYHSPKYVTVAATGNGVTEEKTFYTIAGSSCDAAGKLNGTKAYGKTLKDEVGVLYTLTGYLNGCNTSNKYGTFAIEEEADTAVTAWNFTDDSVTGYVDAETPVGYVITAPVGAKGLEYSSSVVDETICSYDGNVVVGKAAGSTTIKLSIDGVEHELPVTISSERHPCTGLTLDKETASGFAGEEVTIVATASAEVLPCTDPVSWSSSNENVATVDNGVVTLVAEGTATITAKCGVQSASTQQYTATCAVTVNGFGSETNPISIDQALALVNHYCPNEGDVTPQVVYAKGIVATQPDYSGSYIKSFDLKDEASTNKILVYSADKSQTVTSPDQNDLLTIKGYIKNYYGTIEFTSYNSTNVTLLANVRGTSTVGEGNLVSTSITDLSKTSGTNGETFTFKVVPDTGKNLLFVKVNGVIVTAGEGGVYTGEIHGDTLIDATSESATAVLVSAVITDIATRDSWAQSAGSTIEGVYTSFGLDAATNPKITVSTSGSPNCGSFWGSDWRLYQNKDGDLKIEAASGYTIVNVKVTYGTKNDNDSLYLGTTEIASGALVSVGDDSITFTVGNKGDKTNGQVRVTAIEVTYDIAE